MSKGERRVVDENWFKVPSLLYWITIIPGISLVQVSEQVPAIVEEVF